MRCKIKQMQGAALLLVIMITAIMSIIMTLMLHQSKLDSKLAAMVKLRAKAELELHSAQAEFTYQFMSTPLHLVGPDFPSSAHVFDSIVDSFDGQEVAFGNVKVSVQDVSGLVSLLPLDKKSLNLLLVAQQFDDDSLLAFYDRLDDWQDPDSLTRLSGKELGDYQAYPYFPSNIVIQSVDELAYLLDKEIYQNISPYLVLYGDGYMNRQFTPEALYSAAGIENNNSKEYSASIGTSESGVNYPSGRYLIRLSYADKGVSLGKQFLLIRGLGTFQPFFITNEQLF
ncbi:general secretion pathway protein GspK [Thalassotalea ganghwensis]